MGKTDWLFCPVTPHSLLILAAALPHTLNTNSEAVTAEENILWQILATHLMLSR